MSIKKFLKGILLVVCFLLLLLTATGVKAQENTGIDLSMEYGFHDNAKTGTCFPLKIFMENKGADFEGTMKITVPVRGDTYEMTSEFWMGGSQWGAHRDRIVCYTKDLKLLAGESRQEIVYLELPAFDGYLTLQISDGDQIVAQRELSCSFSENNSRVLVGVIAADQNGLTELDGMQIQWDNLYGYSTEVFVKAIALETEDIYPNPDALNQLDVLIIDKGTVFDEVQQTAVTRWKANGGLLVEREGQGVDVLFQNFALSEHREEFQKHLEQMNSYTFGDDGGLSEVPIRERPSMGKYLVILGVYSVLVGPGIYLFLKKKKKQKYLWLSICAASIIFMGIISILGKKTNIYAPFISYSGLYEQQEDVWSETVRIGIQAPYNNSYHLYLDSGYQLLPLNLGPDGIKEYQSETAECVTIHLGEEKNRVAMENMSSFTQNCFELEKNQRIAQEERISLELGGDGEQIFGTWKNPTKYHIRDAVLVFRNRAALLEDMEAYAEGIIADCKLYSYGNGGIELLMRDKMDFSDYTYPDYEISNLSSRIWTALRSEDPDQAYLIGIVENPDLEFQENSGYKIYGTALFQMKVDVNWNTNGYLWCPNLEAYGESLNGEISAETNLMYGKEATVDYRPDFEGHLDRLTFFQADYDDERYFFPFQGNVTMYCWETGVYEDVQDWQGTLWGEKLEHFLSPEGVIRVRYLLDDTINPGDRSCMLPCLIGAGKVG